MADNIDKALNGLDLKTDSLPSDWLITLVNPKEGIPAQNMTIARFTELFGDLLYKSKSLPPEGGVFIMFHRKSDNIPLMVDPDKWPNYQSGGEIADGVAVVEGGKILIVAPTEPDSLLWSSAEVSAGGKKRLTTGQERLVQQNKLRTPNVVAQVTLRATAHSTVE